MWWIYGQPITILDTLFTVFHRHTNCGIHITYLRFYLLSTPQNIQSMACGQLSIVSIYKVLSISHFIFISPMHGCCRSCFCKMSVFIKGYCFPRSIITNGNNIKLMSGLATQLFLLIYLFTAKKKLQQFWVVYVKIMLYGTKYTLLILFCTH